MPKVAPGRVRRPNCNEMIFRIKRAMKPVRTTSENAGRAPSFPSSYFRPPRRVPLMKYAFSAIALAIAAPAFAQSTVTVYGIVDVNGVYAKGAATQVREGSGGLQGSRI